MKANCKICQKLISSSNMNKHLRCVHKIEFLKICECGKSFEKSQSLNAHYRHCIVHRNGVLPVPPGTKNKPSKFKGKTLSEIVQDPESTREKLSKASKGKKWRPKTEISDKSRRDKISIARMKYLASYPHINWFEINGIKVQGTWERDVAQKLLDSNILFQRVIIRYDEYRRYTPDFFIPKLNLYLEVKGWMRQIDLEKYSKVVKQTNIDLRFLIGLKELKSFLKGTINLQDLPNFAAIAQLVEA